MKNSIVAVLMVVFVLISGLSGYLITMRSTTLTTITTTGFITSTGFITRTVTSNVSVYPQLTTITTVTRTTLPIGGSTYSVTTGEYSGCIPPVQCYPTKITTWISIFTSSSSICTNTGGIGCPHFFNQTYAIIVNYSGPWGLSYQGYLASTNTIVEAGNFFGHGSTNETITVSGIDTEGILTCVEAYKLDSSNSVLKVNLQTAQNSNQTSVPYGMTKVCLQYIIA